MQLSPHFQLGEFAVSAGHPALAAPVPAEYVPNVRRLVQRVLEPARRALGVPLVINSGYRSDALNRAVGGSPTSQHRRADAADVTPGRNVPAFTLFRFLMDSLTVPAPHELGQVIWYPSRGFVHIANPSATYPVASFYVHEPAAGLHYRPVTSPDEASALALGRSL